MATSSSRAKIFPLTEALNPHANFLPSSMSKLDPYEHLNIALNRDGTITRRLTVPTIKANPEARHGDSVLSKDVTINPDKKTWVRLYRPTKLPSNDNAVARLPVIIYFHGGGFILFTASTKEPHLACCRLASEISAIVVSVDYRLAPEHRLPAQYEDAMDAIMWVKQQVWDENGERWLKDYGDFSRCYLCGRGSGGNVAFNAALRSVDLDLMPLNISGLVLNQPMFGGSERTRSEMEVVADQVLPLSVLDLLWELALPLGTDREHPFCNPMVDGVYNSKIGSLGRCLVIGFGGDAMVDRMEELVRLMRKCGVRVQGRFYDEGFHNIDVMDNLWANSVLNAIKDFVI
ncbi:hypothetical protein K2173_024845 [Erythroxylum novogranatense]|uniref:Alpha/beta hydrolase fold-3 domain-containing protein n=1 Tax=Erythroxylum novogranatense TaxID=1862640 RepID=A0AAV8UCB6_9ROSI|nr:hypothetical protein K2173_024845 [Erythroxylum novogranatense]